MNDRIRNALLAMYRNMDDAEKRQDDRGGHDQGARNKVTSGRHLDVVADAIKHDLVDRGFKPESVYYENGCLTLPGWFRPTKDWDLMAFDGDELLATVELKSINSSFGNNCNNRTEESIGSAVDVYHAIKNELFPYRAAPPIAGYVMVVRKCEASTKPTKRKNEPIYPIDPVFDGASYLERLTILCRRLMNERLYQAIWIVAVDPSTGEVTEPDPGLTYEKFIARIEAQLAVSRA